MNKLSFIYHCFTDYFHPIIKQFKKLGALIENNEITYTVFSLSLSLIVETIRYFLGLNFFGVSNALIVMIMVTVLLNAVSGVAKSRVYAKKYRLKSLEYPEGSPDQVKFLLKARLRAFSAKQLNYVFFKSFAFLFYLVFIKLLFEEPDGWVESAFIVIMKAPLFLFWYSEYKSIGDNTEVIFGKKAPIFKILEDILEWRFENLYKNPNKNGKDSSNN